eukprot:scaffold29447_cov53-Attheya_sp.AAC.5
MVADENREKFSLTDTPTQGKLITTVRQLFLTKIGSSQNKKTFRQQVEAGIPPNLVEPTLTSGYELLIRARTSDCQPPQKHHRSAQLIDVDEICDGCGFIPLYELVQSKFFDCHIRPLDSTLEPTCDILRRGIVI